MSGLWQSVRNSINKATDAAAIAATKTKLQADVLLIDRSITSRKEQFGVEIYDYVDGNLASTQEFYASDDKLTCIIRPSFIIAQREAKAMTTGRKSRALDNIQKKEIERKGAFPVPAVTKLDVAKNIAISGKMKAEELKLKTDLYAVETKIRAVKAKFGVDVYPVLEKLEDDENWLPPDRNIRALYDQTRRDIEKICKQKQYKKDQIIALEAGQSIDEVMKMPENASVGQVNGDKVQQDMIQRSIQMNKHINSVGSQPPQQQQPNGNSNSYYTNPQHTVNTTNAPLPATGYNNTNINYQPQQPQASQNNLDWNYNDNSQHQQQQSMTSSYGSTSSNAPQQQQQQQQYHDPFNPTLSNNNGTLDIFGQPQQTEKERQAALMFGGTTTTTQQSQQQQQQQLPSVTLAMQQQQQPQPKVDNSSFSFMNNNQQQNGNGQPVLTMQPQQSNSNINIDPFAGL